MISIVTEFLPIVSVYICSFTINCIVPCTTSEMCCHKISKTLTKGIDNLNRNVEINWQFDQYDGCDYVDLENGLDVTDKDLSVIQLNIRGLSSKVNDLKHIIDHVQLNGQPDILLLCETWLSKQSPPVDIPGYSTYRKDRQNKKGGGVAVLVSDHLSSRPRYDLTLGEECESMIVEVKLGSNQALVCSAYRPPNTNCKQFVKEFQDNVKALRNYKNSTLVIGIDHNMDFLKNTNHVNTQNFMETILDNKLTPVITRPTRITHTTATLIDNILVDTNHIGNVTSSIGIDSTSDHLPCMAILHNILMTGREAIEITTRNMSKQRLDRLNTELVRKDWNCLNSLKTCNEKFNKFHTDLTELVDHYTPMYTTKIKFKKLRREPWLTAGLIKSINTDKRLYRQTLKPNHKETDIIRYKNYHQVL